MCLNFKFISIISILILCSCNGEQKYEKESTIFLKYLNHLTIKEIPAEKAYFLFAPSQSCIGCQKSSLKKITDFVNMSNVYVITTPDGASICQFPSDRTYIDSSMLINKVNFSSGGVCVITTNENRIINVTGINPTNVDSALALIR